jgi:hypothetical protein
MTTGMTRTLLILLGVLLVPAVFPQALIPKKCYMHLTGMLDRQIPMTVELVKNNDTVFGECLFPANTNPYGFDFMGYLVSVRGKVSNDGSFVIKLGPDENKVTLTGRFNNSHTLSGNGQEGKNGQSLQFELSESYPEGTTPMNAFVQKGSTTLVKKPKSPVAKIKLSLLLPGESANPLVSDSLKKIILSKYSGHEKPGTEPGKILNEIQQTYFDTYIENNTDIYNASTGQSFNWELLTYMHVVQNTAHLLGFYVEKYAFTGGAHGLQTREYTLVNMYTGKVIELQDIFRGNYAGKLTEILTRKAKERFNVSPGQTLTGAGLFVDEIKPSPEFYVTRTGVGFYYNQYDIAPHSWGQTDFLIPFSELKDILATDGVLRELIR